MEARQFILLGIFVVAAGVSTAEGHFLADGWASFTSQTEEWVQNASEYFEETKESMEKKFKDLSDKIKGWLREKSFKNATADELLKDIPEDGWKEMKPALLMTANKSEIKKLVRIGAGKVPERFLDELDRLLILNLSNEEAIAKVKEGANTLTLSDVVTLMTRLGDHRKWSGANVTALGPAALRLPICIDKIQNKTALMEMKKIIDECQVPNPAGACPEKKDLNIANWFVHRQIHGPIATWNMTDVIDVGGLDDLYAVIINYVSDELIKDAKSDIIKLTFKEEQSSTADAWKRVLCRAEKCQSMSKDEAKTWYNDLDKLKKYIMPSDLSKAAMEDADLKSEVIDNAKAKGRNIKAKDAKMILKDELKNKTPENITKSEVEDIGGSLIVRAPARFLKKAAARKILNNVLQDAALSIPIIQGAEFLAKTSALMKTNMDIVMVNNGFDISLVPDSLMAFINPYILKNLRKEDIKKIVSSASGNGQRLTPYQIDAVLSKFSARELIEYPAYVKEYLSTSDLGILSQSLLAKFSADMTANTPACLMGAKMAFGSKEVLTPAELSDGEDFFPCMSATDAEKISPENLLKAYKAVTDSGKPLSMVACRVLRKKLVDWGNITLGGDKHSLKSIGYQLYLKDMMVIPPCVIADFGETARKFLNREMKTVLMMNMCQMEDLSSISQVNRRPLINSFVKEMVGDADLGMCNVLRLGSCMIDLDSDNLKKLDETASTFYVQYLQMAFKKPVPPCLDKTQEQQIGELLVKVKGPPATWKDASDVSCLLSMLSSTRLMEVPMEVLTSVSCPISMSPFDNGQPELCKRRIMSANMRIKKKQVEMCMHMRKQDGMDTGHDKILCGGVTVMSTPEVEKLMAQEVMDNLAEIGAEDMGKDKAKFLLAKVKESKNITDLTSEELANLGFIWQAFTKEDMEDLSPFSKDYKDVIYKMGQKLMLPKDVMETMVDKVQMEYKGPKQMSSQDLMLLGQLLCFFNKTSVNAIPNSSFRSAMRILGLLDCGNKGEGTSNLAAKAVDAITDNMNFSTLDAAKLHEMNKLVGGLKPEDLCKIPASAFHGMTADGVKSIKPEALIALKTGQIQNLGSSAAMGVSAEQMARLTDEQRQALRGILPQNSFGGGATGLTFSLVLGALAVVLIMLMA